MKLCITTSVAVSLLGLLGTLNSGAQSPGLIGYQGRVQASGMNYSGSGLFKFALLTANAELARPATASAIVVNGFITGYTITDPGAGYTSPPIITITDPSGSGAAATAIVSDGSVDSISSDAAGSGYSANPTVVIAPPPLVFDTLWSNDGSSTQGSEPSGAVGVLVEEGLFSLLLGDTDLSNMRPVPAVVFDQPDIHLRIWFSDGINGFEQLSPDQRLGSVGHAMRADLAGSATEVDWSNISRIPSGFRDGVDDDTTYSAGTGLNLSGTTFSLANQGVATTHLADDAVTASKLAASGSSLQKITGNVIRINGGNVGINTADPAERLDVDGRIKATQLQVTSGAESGRTLISDSQGRASWSSRLRVEGTSTYVDQRLAVHTDTNAPDANLHVMGNFSGFNPVATRMAVIENLGDNSLGFRGSTNTRHRIYFDYPPGTNGSFIQVANTYMVIGQHRFNAINSTSQSFRFHFDNSAGNLGIGRVPTDNRLEVSGTASKATAGDWLANSDRRIKTGIQDITNARDTVMKLRPVKFRYTDEWRERNPSIEDREYHNFVAQEYREVFPHAVKGSGEHLEGDPEEILQIDTHDAQMVTIKVVQELVQENQALRTELEELKRSLNALNRRLIGEAP
jgi:hypothetical protein